MQDIIKRHFWILGALVTMTCAIFAAKATSSVVAAKYLGDPTKARKVVVTAPSASAPAPKTPARSKDGTQFASRNIFCSECTPPVDVVVKTDDGSVQQTTLPLVLLATNVGTREEDSYAPMS